MNIVIHCKHTSVLDAGRPLWHPAFPRPIRGLAAMLRSRRARYDFEYSRNIVASRCSPAKFGGWPAFPRPLPLMGRRLFGGAWQPDTAPGAAHSRSSRRYAGLAVGQLQHRLGEVAASTPPITDIGSYAACLAADVAARRPSPDRYLYNSGLPEFRRTAKTFSGVRVSRAGFRCRRADRQGCHCRHRADRGDCHGRRSRGRFG